MHILASTMKENTGMNLTCKGSFPEGSGCILVQFLHSFYVIVLRQHQNQGNVIMAIFGGYQENLPNGGRMYLGNLGARIITAIRRRPRRLGAPAGDWDPIISKRPGSGRWFNKQNTATIFLE